MKIILYFERRNSLVKIGSLTDLKDGGSMRVDMRIRVATILSVTAFSLCLAIRLQAAELCSQQLNNAVGDTISGAVTQASTDLGESGEIQDRFVFESSGGEIHAETFGGFNVPQPFQFVATTANIRLSGSYPEYDRDESCDIQARVNGHLPFTLPQKAAARNAVGKFSGAIAVVAAIAKPACGLGPAICAATLGLGASLGLFAGMAGQIAGDPPDQNFTSVIQPDFQFLHSVGTGGIATTRIRNDFDNLFVNASYVQGYGDAAYAAASRGWGADNAGDDAWAQTQANAAKGYLKQLGAMINSQVGLISNLSKDLRGSGFNAAVTNQEVIQFQGDFGTLAQGNYGPAFSFFGPGTIAQQVAAKLRDFGLSDDQVENLKDLVIVSTIPVLRGIVVNGFTIDGTKQLSDLLDSLVPVLQTVGAAFSK